MTPTLRNWLRRLFAGLSKPVDLVDLSAPMTDEQREELSRQAW